MTFTSKTGAATYHATEDRSTTPKTTTGSSASRLLPVRHGNIRYTRNLVISGIAFLTAFYLVFRPGLIDIPAVRLLNSYANRSALVDTLLYDFDTYFTFSGIMLITVLWSCWFKNTDLETRARIGTGTLASILAGGVSRLLQHHLHTHVRPYYDQTIGFHVPSRVDTAYNTWNCFPSDHAAVFAGLTVTIFLVRPRVSILLTAWLVIVEAGRAYMGAHYPSDLMGGAALAALAVWASQSPLTMTFGRRIASYERSSPALFYLCAFFITYQIGTLFVDIRRVSSDLSSLIHVS